MHALAQISHVIGPASLAVYALNFSRISFLDTVTVLFGYFLAEKLEPTNLFWVRIPSVLLVLLSARRSWGISLLHFCIM
jgi:hypothetical protein